MGGRGGRGWEERRGAQRGAEDEDGDEKMNIWGKMGQKAKKF